MTATTTLQASSQNQLRQFIEQIERLTEEAKATADDIRDKYAEAKAIGFDPKIMKKIVSLRKKSKADREEEEALLETYMHALGMLNGTPMGDWMSRHEAAENIAEMARADGAKEETTISINGGPEVPLSVAMEAVDEVRRRRPRRTAPQAAE